MEGEAVGHYRVLRRLGGGGMGEVYLAEDTRLGREVALKFLRADTRQDAESRARLMREARAASALRSPNIAVTYDVGEHDGTLFIAMEYVDGENLAERISRGPLPLREAVDVAAQLADALDDAHAHHIVHRDIKSANLIQTRRGLVKVLDFGLAKMEVPSSTASRLETMPLLVTSPGLVVGTVSYMAPEQLMGGEMDHRADLFSAGVVLYEMLTGRLPFVGDSLAEVSDRILHHEPPAIARFNYGVPVDLETIVRKALEKNASYRYQSARELQIDLQRLARRLEGESTTTSSMFVRPADPLPAAGTSPAHTASGERTIAVLTFANVTREATDDWIGTGIAETVTADLKNVPHISVIGRAQIFDLLKNFPSADAGDDRLAIEIGRRLGAWWVVAGAYQRLGARIRITAHLVEVLTASLIRTVKIDGRLEDIFELQDRVVFELSRSLDVKLGTEDAAAIERDQTRSVEAFEAYSRGVVNLRSAGRDAIDRAIALFERAVELDPEYAAAWAALGGANNLKGTFLSLPDLQHKAIERLRRALTLNPALPNAHVWLAASLLSLGQVDEGIAELRTAERLDPANPDVHQSLARAYWMWRGMVAEGLAELRTAIALNPEGGYPYLQLSFLEALNGDLDAAEQSARSAIELQERAMSGTEGLLIVGAHARLGYVHYLRQDYDASYAEYRRELEYLNSSDHALRERTLIELHQKLSALHDARGDRDQALRFGNLAVEALERRVAAGSDDPATRYYVAAVFARRGELEPTLKHLALPLSRLPQFTRWRLPRDVDFRRVLDRIPT
jgi:TolB-like protein/predicted Ser/Thr protein kinase/Tfp pilus assembly protein PilF